MSATNFEPSLKCVLRSEGGYVNNPKDSGHATNDGVTQAVYNAYRVHSGLPVQSVRSISMAEVEAIYRLQFWNAVQGDTLPVGIDYLVFDDAVNSGPVEAVRELQACLGITVDGHLGLRTLQAVQGVNDRRALVLKLCARRLTFLRRLHAWITFGRGWTNRVHQVQDSALGML